MKQIDFSKPFITAHRGASGLVKHENTLEAFEKAIEVGADSIECDVRKTKDGIIIVNHNPDIEGLIIKDHTYNEICEATLKNGYTQPTLKEALKLVKGRILIDIEIKEPGYEQELIDEITSIINVGEFYIRAFSDEAIKKVKEINHDITAVLLIGREHVKFGIFSRLDEIFPRKRIKYTNCDAVSPNYQLLILSYCARIHKLGKKVFVWTVDDEKLMQKVIKKGADALITDYPDIGLEVVKKIA